LLAAKGQYAEAVHQLLFKSIQDISIARPSVEAYAQFALTPPTPPQLGSSPRAGQLA